MSLAPLAVGDIIHGFANGAFGRDSYDCRRIEAVGPDWVVCRYESGAVDLAAGAETLKLCQANREPVIRPDGWDDRDQAPCCTFGGQVTGLTTWGLS